MSQCQCHSKIGWMEWFWINNMFWTDSKLNALLNLLFHWPCPWDQTVDRELEASGFESHDGLQDSEVRHNVISPSNHLLNIIRCRLQGRFVLEYPHNFIKLPMLDALDDWTAKGENRSKQTGCWGCWSSFILFSFSLLFNNSWCPIVCDSDIHMCECV